MEINLSDLAYGQIENGYDINRLKSSNIYNSLNKIPTFLRSMYFKNNYSHLFISP